MRVLVYVVPVALAIYALIDLWRSRAEERAGLHPALWALIIIFVPVLGPVAWILTSVYVRSQQRAAGGPTRPAGPARPGRTPRRRQGPVAPDDDPDFLWRLERERRRREQRGSDGSTGDAGPVVPEPEDPTSGPQADDDGDTGPDGPSGRGSGWDAGAGKDDDGRRD
jgi:hypothetical protein